MEQAWYPLAAHPAVQSGLLPFGLACLMTGLLRLRSSGLVGLRGAGVAIAIPFLSSGWLIAGLTLPGPLSAVQKLMFVALMGLIIGTALERFAVAFFTLRSLAIGLLLAAVLWLVWPQLQRAALDWPVILLALGCGGLLFKQAEPAQRPAHDSVPLLLTAAGIAGVALMSGSLLIAQLAIALAMANLGFLLWNWPQARDLLGASVLLGVTLPLLALAFITVLLTQAPAWSLAPLAALFFLDNLARRLWVPRERWRHASQPLYVLILGSMPVALAIALAMLAKTPDGAYYY